MKRKNSVKSEKGAGACRKKKPEETFKQKIKRLGRAIFEILAYFSVAFLIDLFWYSGMVPFQPAIQGCPWIYIVSCLILVIIYTYALKKCSSMFRLAVASALLAALPILLTHHDKSIANDNSNDVFNDFLKRFLLLNLKLESFRILTFIKSLCLRKGVLSFFFDKEDTEFLFS